MKKICLIVTMMALSIVIASSSALADRIDAYTNVTSLATDDEFILWDTDPGAVKNITFGNLRSLVNNPVTQCAVISAPAVADDLPIFKAPYALTIVGGSIHVQTIGGTSVVGQLDECTGTAGACTGVTAVDSSDITGTAGADVADDGTLSNAGIASGNWILWRTTAVNGTPTSVSICFSYTIDP